MITDFQREQRRKYLGSSDAPSLVGVNPWKNAADVYWDKIRESEDNSEEKLSDALIVGTLCENAVLDWFSRETGKKIIRNQRRVHDNKIMAASFDALVADNDEEAVEAKTAGVTSFLDREAWGAVETDEVPEHIIIQCQHQMSIIPTLRVVHVPVLLGGVGFRMYHVERNDELIKSLENIEVEFWKKHVEQRVPPPDTLPNLETIKTIKRIPKKTIPLPNQLVKNWLDAKEAASSADKKKLEAQKALLAALGDAEAGECDLGTLTYLEQSRKEYLVKASTYRVPRFKAVKKAVKEAA